MWKKLYNLKANLLFNLNYFSVALLKPFLSKVSCKLNCDGSFLKQFQPRVKIRNLPLSVKEELSAITDTTQNLEKILYCFPFPYLAPLGVAGEPFWNETFVQQMAENSKRKILGLNVLFWTGNLCLLHLTIDEALRVRGGEKYQLCRKLC